jgi:hypothetical protein
MWITGQVVDDRGRALSDVTIEISGPGGGRKRIAVTNKSGQYVLQDLRPGAYTLKFGCSGFHTLERKTDALTTYVATINAQLTRRLLEPVLQ